MSGGPGTLKNLTSAGGTSVSHRSCRYNTHFHSKVLGKSDSTTGCVLRVQHGIHNEGSMLDVDARNLHWPKIRAGWKRLLDRPTE